MTATIAEEERAARKKHRDLEKARRHAATARERDYRARLRAAVGESKHLNPRCHCDFTGVTSRAGLVALGGGCTDPYFVCPRLDAVRRRMG
jgi:hypothetical protein